MILFAEVIVKIPGDKVKRTTLLNTLSKSFIFGVTFAAMSSFFFQPVRNKNLNSENGISKITFFVIYNSKEWTYFLGDINFFWYWDDLLNMMHFSTVTYFIKKTVTLIRYDNSLKVWYQMDFWQQLLDCCRFAEDNDLCSWRKDAEDSTHVSTHWLTPLILLLTNTHTAGN